MANQNNPNPTVPVTRIRLRIPKGMKIEDVMSKLEISFESVDPSGLEFNQNHCCVDVALVGPVSTISAAPKPPREDR